MFSFFEYILPVKLILKVIIILVIALMSIASAIILKSKLSFVALIAGFIVILVVWLVDFEVNL